MNQIKLTAPQIVTLVVSKFPHDKANVLAEAIQDRMIINDDNIYTVQNNITYICCAFKKNQFISTISNIISSSFKQLNDNEREYISTTYEEYAKIFTNKNLETYLPQLQTKLEKDIKFDFYFNEIHFENGYYDLLNGKFENRILGKHYITKFISRQYAPSTDKEKTHIMKYIKQIIPSDEDCKTILMTFGSALSGKSVAEQDLLILLGEGSAGKSFLLQMVAIAIECYFKELKDDTFCQSNAKIDKIMNSFASDPQIRVTWINEAKDSRFDDSVIKTFCDGKLQTTKLYQDGSFSINHYSKPILTMNNMPNIKMDSGIARRLKGYEHVSKFVDNPCEVDESKHIYLKNKHLGDEIAKQPNLLNAIFDILANYCKSWLHGEQIQYSQVFHDTKNSVVASNDHIQDFVDANLEFTMEDGDRIGKANMMQLYTRMYPNKHLSILQLISSLKSKGVKYSPDYRVHNVKGAFYCVKPCCKEDKDDDELVIDKVNNNNVFLQKENESLKKEIQRLNDLLKAQIQQPIVEPAPIVQPAPKPKISKEDIIKIIEGNRKCKEWSEKWTNDLHKRKFMYAIKNSKNVKEFQKNMKYTLDEEHVMSFQDEDNKKKTIKKKENLSDEDLFNSMFGKD